MAVLAIRGEMYAIPDLSDAYEKFSWIKSVDAAFIDLEIVEARKLAMHESILNLTLRGNEISQLDADTFDDLKQLQELILADNHLKFVHPDLFSKLHRLQEIWLQNNQLEVLPEGLFRNNPELTKILASENNLKTIAIDFLSLPKLINFDFKRNDCIDEWYVVDISSKEKMQKKIWEKCHSSVNDDNIKK